MESTEHREQSRLVARRITAILVTAMLIGTVLMLAAQAASARQRCTVQGTASDDLLVDTGGASVICARGGNDSVEGAVQGDTVRGGGGDDRLDGNDGSDVVVGGRGADTLTTADGVGGNDVARGGRGQDTCIIDEGDRAKGCETKQVVV